MNRPLVKYFPLIVIGFSFTVTVLFYRYYLQKNSLITLQNFYQQNINEFANKDIFTIVKKIDRLSSNLNYRCITIHDGESLIYKKGQSECIINFFSAENSIQSKYNSSFVLRAVLRLPVEYEFVIGSFLFLQIMFLIVIWIFSKKIEFMRNESENRRLALLNQLATQVAHDIRSPLATIDMITNNRTRIDNENFELLKSAAKRIHGIANDLLERNRHPQSDSPSLKAVDLAATLKSIIKEKKVQVTTHDLKFIIPDNSIYIKGDEVELSRIISNLLNNAIEASDDFQTVSISLEMIDDHAAIIIKDQGKGIPEELLAKLGERGITHGKSKGNGLGIFHAKSTVESWGGKLQILSTVGEGTSISLIFPIVEHKKKHIVLLDDDDLLRLTWESKARTENIGITTFSHPDDLLKAISKLPENAVYYIDSCLSDEIKGEDIALQLSKLGISDIYLATGFEADKFADLDHIKGVVGKDFPE